MKKLWPSLLVSCLFLSACGDEKEQNVPSVVDVVEAEKSYASGKPYAPVVVEFISENDRARFQKAIKDAVKIDGAVNMAAPHYKIIDDEESYFLWLNEDGSATLMNVSDTHAIYEMDESSNIKELVTTDS